MQNRRSETISEFLFLISNVAVLIFVFNIGSCSSAEIYNNNTRFRLHSDASALLSFKSNADLWNKLDFSKKTGHRYCQWRGVTCYGNRVVRLVIEDLYLGGELAPDSLSRLDQLRVLSLRNNSLEGTIPDFSGLVNLKSLFLNRNSFSGPFPPSLLSLHRLRTIDMSFNNLTGHIPAGLIFLDHLIYLRLESNRFNGTVPALNQSSLQTFNVSVNNLTGAVPVTATLQRFSISSFLANPNLCGLIVHRECHPTPSFFGPATPAETGGAPQPAIMLNQSMEVRGVESTRRSHKRITAIIGLLSGGLILIASIFCFIISVRRRRDEGKISTAVIASEAAATAEAAAVIQMEQESELEEKVKKAQQGLEVAKSGSVVFCAGEAHMYSLDQLMRASAELLGRGIMGTTYKAVLDNRLIVCVKRLDALRLAGLPKENFVRRMESVGALRHPNLVPLRAYFQAKEERLLIYDYQPNGSLSSLVHGTKSTRAKPLHWTSCLKIAEDVAQGLSYIHQAWRLVHGNLKSSNVLLGPDFEACIADYCLPAPINSDHSSPLDRDHHDSDSSACKAPETRGNSNPHTTKSDVYSFGILLLELLTGKQPSELPCLPPDEMVNWVRSVRDGDDNDGSRLWMLCEVAVSCSLVSPEQRPTMWQVLKMLQEIKEAAVSEDGEMMTMETSSSGMS